MDTEDDIREMIAEDKHERGDCDYWCDYCAAEADKQERQEMLKRSRERAPTP